MKIPHKKTLVRKLEKKRSLGRTRRRWEERISMYLKETEYEGV
jgi:hypothetical protein